MVSSVIFCAERIGRSVVKTLLAAGKNIAAVFTVHPRLRSSVADFVDFRDLEKEYPATDFHYIMNSNSKSLIKKIKRYRPDVIYVVSWSQIIPAAILAIPTQGTIGLHYSLLPRRRGGAPLNWAIIDGLSASGITLYYMDEGIDSGDIIAQRQFTINDTDTVADLLNKIDNLAPELILSYYDEIAAGTAPRLRQDKRKVTYTPRRRPADSRIDWTWKLNRIYNFIRALAPPYPSAFYREKNKKIIFTGVERVTKKKLKIKGYIIEETKNAER